jgi:hypothetical protein
VSLDSKNLIWKIGQLISQLLWQERVWWASVWKCSLQLVAASLLCFALLFSSLGFHQKWFVVVIALGWRWVFSFSVELAGSLKKEWNKKPLCTEWSNSYNDIDCMEDASLGRV